MKKFKLIHGKLVEYSPEEYALWDTRVKARIAFGYSYKLGHWLDLWRGVQRNIREDYFPGRDWWKLQLPTIKKLYREQIERSN